MALNFAANFHGLAGRMGARLGAPRPVSGASYIAAPSRNNGFTRTAIKPSTLACRLTRRERERERERIIGKLDVAPTTTTLSSPSSSAKPAGESNFGQYLCQHISAPLVPVCVCITEQIPGPRAELQQKQAKPASIKIFRKLYE